MSTTRDHQYAPFCINKPLQKKKDNRYDSGLFYGVVFIFKSEALKLRSRCPRWSVPGLAFSHIGWIFSNKMIVSICSCFLKPTDLLRSFHFTSLIDEEYPCSRKSGISGICQFSDSGVVNEPSDKQHEAWTAKKTGTST